MVGIGIVGVGGIACGKHIPEIEQSKSGKVVAICDINPARLKEVGERLGIDEAHRFADYAQLIACPEVDAVEVCTPNYVHAPIAAAAVQAGKPVNVEKPLSVDLPSAGVLTEALKANPVPNMMCFSYRFMPAVRFAKWMMEQGCLGEIVSVHVEYLKDSALWEGRRLDWRFVREYAGTGVLGDLGVHLIDMAQFLVGDMEAVCSTAKTVVKQRQRLDSEEWAPVETDDYCSFLADMAGGVSAVFEVTRCAIGHSNTIRFDIYGRDGMLSFDLNHPDVLKICVGKIDVQGQGLHTVTVPQKFRIAQEQMFVDLVSGAPTPYLPTIEDGVKCQKILDALLQSSRERRWIALT
ncbi:MAG: Gfo/Idh/MocA family oxidoreductase [Eubacteriales bacterium]|nr:Gfo/Idh/MocA family oxidoreductase [Eubacteriales bacterium]